MENILENKAKIDEYCKHHMLQVKDLVAYLQKQDQEANILYFEVNSNAWCQTIKDFPNPFIKTVAEEKIDEEKYLKTYYKEISDENERNSKIHEHMNEVFRYSLSDNDIVMRF